MYQLPEDFHDWQHLRCADLREEMIVYAHLREKKERERGGERSRTHYRVTLSFETPAVSVKALSLTKRWLEESFSSGRGAAFLHTNTRFPHVHVWLEARQTDGRKIHLDWRQFHRLDEVWNRLYSEALGREEREHLEKKWEREEYRRRCFQGEKRTPPERAASRWHSSLFTERERLRLETGYECHQSRTETDKPTLTPDPPDAFSKEPRTQRREPVFDQSASRSHSTERAAWKAVQETERLCEALTHMGKKTRERERTVERGQEV